MYITLRVDFRRAADIDIIWKKSLNRFFMSIIGIGKGWFYENKPNVLIAKSFNHTGMTKPAWLENKNHVQKD